MLSGAPQPCGWDALAREWAETLPLKLWRARERYRELVCTCTDVRRLPFAHGSFVAVHARKAP